MSEENKTNTDLKLPTAQELLDAGVHLGHKTSRWHPKMGDFIYGARNGVHIFDLEKTLEKFQEALVFLRNAATHGNILFVGTKPAAKALVRKAGQDLSMPFVSERWLGGTLTNFKTITKRLNYFRDLEDQQKMGDWEKFTKKERGQLQKKLAKLQKQLEGIKSLNRIPEALFVVDVKVDNTALREAKIIGIPVVAICDSSVDPNSVEYPIPANDDAVSALTIIIDTIIKNLKGINPSFLKSEKSETPADARVEAEKMKIAKE